MLKGVKEAITFEENKIDLRTANIEMPDTPPDYSRIQVKQIREQILKVSQPIFARILGVSSGAVKAWELGTNKPQGSSARLIQMAKTDPEKFKELILELE